MRTAAIVAAVYVGLLLVVGHYCDIKIALGIPTKFCTVAP